MRTESETLVSVAVGDLQVQYSERGDGEPVLLVHGGVFADWFAPMLASDAVLGIRAIRIRRAGYGRNEAHRLVTIEDHANHLAVLVDHLRLNKVHVLGHSSGGLIALQLAANSPELVQSLILLEPAPGGALQVPAFAKLAENFVTPAMHAFEIGDLRGAFHSFMSGVCGNRYRDVIEKVMGIEAYERAVVESEFFFSNEIPAVTAWALSDSEIARITQPVLLLEGSDSRSQGALSRQVTECVLQLLPQTEFVIVPNANHLLPLQAAEEIGRLTANFVCRGAHSAAPNVKHQSC